MYAVYPYMIFAFLGLMALPAQAATYINARFGYSISYPESLLIAEREADNGDGRTFHAHNGTAKVSVWGANRDDDSEKTPQAIARSYQTDCGAKPANQVIKPKLVAFSCATAAGRVIYQKILIDS